MNDGHSINEGFSRMLVTAKRTADEFVSRHGGGICPGRIVTAVAYKTAGIAGHSVVCSVVRV